MWFLINLSMYIGMGQAIAGEEMTTKQAIEVLTAYRKLLSHAVSNQLDGDIQAFDMGIEALRAQDKVVKTPEKDLLMIKANCFHLPTDMMDYWRDRILEERKDGVIILPNYLSAEIVPADVEIKFEDTSRK